MRKLLLARLADGRGVCCRRRLPRPTKARGACRANVGPAPSRRSATSGRFEACRDERSLWGTTAFCSQNPRYLPYWQGRGFGQEPGRTLSRKKKHRH